MNHQDLGMFSYETRIAGSSYYPDSRYINVNDQLTIQREPTNEYDPNAIKLLHNRKLVGYVPKDIARELCSKIDLGVFVKVVCTRVGQDILIKIKGHLFNYE